MVQCLQIRPVSLKHTSTQQLLMKVFVLHSFPTKKFLKLSPSIVPNNANMFNSKNVIFIVSDFLFRSSDCSIRIFSDDSNFCYFDFSIFAVGFDNRSKLLVFIILKHYPKGWRRLIDFLISDSDGGGVYVTTLRCRVILFEFFDFL